MEKLFDQISSAPRTWLLTGVAGFIGSHLLETLLRLDQRVLGIDNLSTGFEENIHAALAGPPPSQQANFEFLRGDLIDAPFIRRVFGENRIDIVLHQAALGSVPRSMSDPISTNSANLGGFINLIATATQAGVIRFVYASSSSVYGDSMESPKSEDCLGSPLSPYAVSKLSNELYAGVFSRAHDISAIGLRYFNVFGPRQNPDGPYAAVIPRWIKAISAGDAGTIYGDGSTSRDFCYIKNVVRANLLAATAPGDISGTFNIAAGASTTLNELYRAIVEIYSDRFGPLDRKAVEPRYEPFRPGDIKHSLADISKAERVFGYKPTHTVRQGLQALIDSLYQV